MIILQGMCYSGKTTCGALVAEKLKMPFLDSRDLFLRTHNMTEIQYLETHGRDEFCEAEKNTLIQDLGNIVLSLGGSACYYDDIMNEISKLHTVVWLNVPFEAIEKRRKQENKQRPIVFPQGISTFQDLYEQRKILYEKYATHRVNVTCTESPKETTDKIIHALF